MLHNCLNYLVNFHKEKQCQKCFKVASEAGRSLDSRKSLFSRRYQETSEEMSKTALYNESRRPTQSTMLSYNPSLSNLWPLQYHFQHPDFYTFLPATALSFTWHCARPFQCCLRRKSIWQVLYSLTQKADVSQCSIRWALKDAVGRKETTWLRK